VTAPLLQAQDLRKEFSIRHGLLARRSVVAVDGISLKIEAGERVGLVGESGSGKSTVARLLLRLIEPSSGSISLEGRDLLALSAAELRGARRHMQMVFQNPHTALYPRMSVGQALAEPLRIQGNVSGAEMRARTLEMLNQIGLPRSFLYRYPHELSGGQKQRICIGRALMLRPRLLILDEPTSALDVSVQAQILEFLLALQRDFALAYLFISHNLAVIRATCSRVLVMQRGRLVEEGMAGQVFERPAHPYTAALIAATLEPGAVLTDPDVRPVGRS
jgi:ABC-type glutathione transport system ATPase component